MKASATLLTKQLTRNWAAAAARRCASSSASPSSVRFLVHLLRTSVSLSLPPLTPLPSPSPPRTLASSPWSITSQPDLFLKPPLKPRTACPLASTLWALASPKWPLWMTARTPTPLPCPPCSACWTHTRLTPPPLAAWRWAPSPSLTSQRCAINSPLTLCQGAQPFFSCRTHLFQPPPPVHKNHSHGSPWRQH